MPTYRHKDTGKRFLFIHIPRTAGRFIQENIRLNGYEAEQDIWQTIDGVEISHLHRELYQKYLDVENIEHIAIIRDPVDRYISLKSYSFYPKGWFRPQVDYITSITHLWNFEDGFGEDFGSWMSEKLQIKFNVKELDTSFLYNTRGQPLYLEYCDPEYKKIVKTKDIEEYVRNFYRLDRALI